MRSAVGCLRVATRRAVCLLRKEIFGGSLTLDEIDANIAILIARRKADF